MKKQFAALAVTVCLTLTLTGCSVIESLLPEEEQPTLTVFDDSSEVAAPAEDSIFEEPAEPATQEPSGEPADQPAEEPAPVAAAQTIAQLYDNLDDLVSAVSLACAAENTLGSQTQVSVLSPQSPPPPYVVLYVTETNVERGVRALAYYPTAENLNPEILEDYTPHICALEGFYPSTIRETLGEDVELDAKTPKNINIQKTGAGFFITLPNATHIITVTGGLVSETQIIKPEETTTRTITYNLDKAQYDLFDQLYRIARIASDE